MRNEAQIPDFLQKWQSNDPRPIFEKLGYDPFEGEIPPPVDKVGDEKYSVIGTPMEETGNAEYLYCHKTGKFLLREYVWDDDGVVTSVYEEFDPTK